MLKNLKKLFMIFFNNFDYARKNKEKNLKKPLK